MTKAQEILEVAMIAAILTDAITEKLYAKMQERGTGYISTVEEIANWSVEFFQKNKQTNWEEVMENEMKPLSNTIKSIICFDDAVIDFGHYNLSKF